MKRLFIAALMAAFMTGCNDDTKEENSETQTLSAKSFILSQIAHVDSSLYRIEKIETVNGGTPETTFVRREDFRELAKDFTEMPDITEKKFKKKYEEVNSYDQALERVVFSFTPKDKGLEIIRQEITVAAGSWQGDKVKNIYVERSIGDKNTPVLKRMLWSVDQSFQVVTMTQKPNEPEHIVVTKVIWTTDKPTDNIEHSSIDSTKKDTSAKEKK